MQSLPKTLGLIKLKMMCTTVVKNIYLDDFEIRFRGICTEN